MREAGRAALGCVLVIVVVATIRMMPIPWTELSTASAIAATAVLGALALGALIGLVRLAARWGK